jgi:RHS repeat-associated protein
MSRRAKRKNKTSPKRRRFMPRLERLEDRWLPTVGVFVEDFTNDSGPLAGGFAETFFHHNLDPRTSITFLPYATAPSSPHVMEIFSGADNVTFDVGAAEFINSASVQVNYRFGGLAVQFVGALGTLAYASPGAERVFPNPIVLPPRSQLPPDTWLMVTASRAALGDITAIKLVGGEGMFDDVTIEVQSNQQGPQSVSWAVDRDGAWDDPANWSTGRVPRAEDDVIVDRPAGNFTITVRQDTAAAHSLLTNETLVVSGGVLAVGTTVGGAGSVRLAGGILRGGTVLPGMTVHATTAGGTLDGVTVDGELNLTDADARAIVTHGLVLDGTARLGGFSRGFLGFLGSETLTGTGQVIFGPDPLNALYLVDPATTLTVGPGITLHGNSGEIGSSTQVGSPFDVGVTNDGTIRADVPGPGLRVTAASFANHGTLEARTGGVLGVTALVGMLGQAAASGGSTFSVGGDFVIDRPLNVTAGSTLDLHGTWTNKSTLIVDHSTVNLGGTYTLATLGRFEHTSAAINITGVLDNLLTTLTVDPGSQWSLAGGTVRAGNIVAAPGGRLRLTPQGGMLSRVTIEGEVEAINDARATVTGGLTLNGIVRLGNDATPGRLDFAGTQTLAGSGQVILGEHPTNALRLLDAGTSLVIGQSMTVRGAAGYIGFSPIVGGPADVMVENEGTVAAEGVGRTVSGNILVGSHGSLRVVDGATYVDQNAHSGVVNSGRVMLFADGTFETSKDLLATTTDPDHYTPLGTILLDGIGTAAAPQLLEVMSRDQGDRPEAFRGGFVHGALRLGQQAYVRLVDQADNTPGTGAEALYVNSLVVPAGATLDLNGLRLYTRAALIEGTVVGVIARVSDSSVLPFGRTTPGNIAAPGDVDDWTFFGRAGQRVAVVVNLADTFLVHVGPVLERAEVRVLGPDGGILATANSPRSTGSVTIPEVILPAAGNHRIDVRAPAAFASLAGNYVVTLWDAPRDVALLRLNERLSGRIETPFGEDRWQFAATAGQQVRLSLVGSSFAGLSFRLTGPSGAVIFDDLSGDSDPITLPASGSYVLTASGRGGTTGTYTVRFGNSTVIELPVNTTFNGALLAAEQDLLFHVRLDRASPLLVFLDDFSNENRSEVYVKRGQIAMATDFDYRSATALTADPQALVPMASPGDWYVLVHGTFVGRVNTPFTLRAETAGVLLTSVTPAQLGNTVDGFLSLTGAGLGEVASVEAVATNGTAYPAAIQTQSPTLLTARLAAGSVPPGGYAVRVTTRTGETVRREKAFVMNAGGVAHLEARLVVPQIHGPGAGDAYVEYRNTGTAAMPAALLIVRVLTPGWAPVLDFPRVREAFWSPALPDGISDTIQILAVGNTPGLLQPGESFQVPYTFVRVAGGLGNNAIDQRLTVTTTANTEGVDWTALRDTVRPPHLDPIAWSAIWANFTAQAGRTWGDYVRMLGDNAAYLQRLGQRVIDVGQLFPFELLQAQGLHPIRTLSSSVDADVETPGLGLGLTRSFDNAIASRYQRGAFGRGWSHSWESMLNVEPDGTVFITGPGGGERRFHADRRSAGYFTQPGDYGALTRNADGTFDLREKDGLLRHFRNDGRLDYVQDLNGNRITAAYTSGRLTLLTHSAGQSLIIAYNAAGLIEAVTDSEGETTRYTYDAANEHLVSVQSPDGRVERYTYSTGAGAAREHALTSIQSPSGATRYFEYDSAGRLASTFLTGNAERVDFSFDSAGTVTVRNAVGNSKVFLDGRGLVVQIENGTGRVSRFTIDDQFRLTRVTDANGLSMDFGYDGRGNVTRSTDQLGHVTAFGYGQPVAGVAFDRLSSITDANGNTTRFGHDGRGNFTATIYPDQTVERATIDALGNIQSFTNRRGRPVTFTHNAAGQITRKTYADGSTIDATYDARGNLATLTDADGPIRFAHDAGDRLTRVDYPTDRFLQYTYDAAGRRTRMVDQDGFAVIYRYDAADRLDRLTDDAGGLIVAYAYDAAGRVVRKELGGGGFTTYEYDATDQLQHLVNYGPDGSVHSRFDYTYDLLGRRIGLATLDGAWTYEYDAIGQLTHAQFASTNSAIANQDLCYDYDAVGNRVRTVVNGVTTDYVTNNLNQYVQVGGARYEYDADGNLVSITNSVGTFNFTYDDESRLTGAVTPEGAWLYDYDPLGNRIATTQNGQRTEYLIDPTGLGNVVGEYSGGPAAHYAHGLGLVSRFDPLERRNYEFDGMGNVIGMTEADGHIANRYAYSPFGERLFAQEASLNAFQFVGEFGVMHETNGLEFMRARYFAPGDGRFMSSDPIRLAGLDENLYRYACNSPTNAVDPNGSFAFVLVLLAAAEGISTAALIDGAIFRGICCRRWPWARRRNRGADSGRTAP